MKYVSDLAMFLLFFFSFSFAVLGLELGLHLEPFHHSFFVKVFFQTGSRETICPGWLLTEILLISAS
jgi:hypothetical protein